MHEGKSPLGKLRAFPLSLASGKPHLVRLSLFGFGLSELGNADGLAAQLATLDHIQQFIDGSAPQLGLAIAMNGDPNSIILENSPVAFHLTTLLVNEGGVDLRQLVLFGNGDKPQNKAEQAASIKTLQFAAEYGSVVVVK
jgi:hypothetical protein